VAQLCDIPVAASRLVGWVSIVVDLAHGLPIETAMPSCLLGTVHARRLGRRSERMAEVFLRQPWLLHVGCLAYSHETDVPCPDLRLRGYSRPRVRRSLSGTIWPPAKRPRLFAQRHEPKALRMMR
jgi:hypothetical protein